MNNDPRRTRHWTLPDDPEPGSITRVPCFECDGTGLVPPEKRAEQRHRAGAPPSTLPADRHEKK